jgi:hypothetical protein
MLIFVKLPAATGRGNGNNCQRISEMVDTISQARVVCELVCCDLFSVSAHPQDII